MGGLTPEEEMAVHAKITQKLEQEGEKIKAEMAERASHKIQILFTSDRKAENASYTISFWESGKRLHGGGDEMMFICRRRATAKKVRPVEVIGRASKALTERGCDAIIPGHLAEQGVIVCPECHTRHETDQIGDSVFYRTTMREAARVLAYWWDKLKGDADINVKYSPSDPRVQLMVQTVGVAEARRLRGLTVYPLKRIIKDVSTGASVESRFYSLLTA